LATDLKNDHLDIFHGLSHEIPYFLSGNMPFKKVVTMHDLIFLRYPEFFPLVDRIVYKEKFSYACKNSDLVIAICEQTKQDLIEILNVDEKKITVHYQSCAPIFYHSLEQSQIAKLREKYNLKKPFIINVGAFEERKNQLGLLVAYAQISNQVDEDLVFVGQGKKYKDMVKEKSRELKLSHRVHFLDAVSFDELPAVYQAASVFCFPSLFEGFGIPIIEALFSKTPVITSFGSCFPESAGPDSFFVDPLSSSSIADGLVKVLGDQNLKNKMSTNGLNYVQRFHLEDSTSELMKIYNHVLK
jgi:glycosyltransferase involved in cell wall biosynthesis